MGQGSSIKVPQRTEERTISYEDESQVGEILLEMQIEDFLLVEHSSRKKQLTFKKALVWPESFIQEED